MMADLFNAGFVWSDDAPVASAATLGATSETPGNLPQNTPTAACVADVATVAGWSKAVRSLERGSPPDGLSGAEWRRLCADARSVAVLYAADLLALGWTTLEIFGTNGNPRHRRVDRLGLVALLEGRTVECFDADTATIRTGSLDRTRFYRRLMATGGIRIWDLEREGRS